MKPDDAAIVAQTHAANAILRMARQASIRVRAARGSGCRHHAIAGEDYDNASSRELTHKTANGQPSDRKQDNWPIAVDADGVIIDGNHRHAAAVMNGRKAAWALVARKQR